KPWWRNSAISTWRTSGRYRRSCHSPVAGLNRELLLLHRTVHCDRVPRRGRVGLATQSDRVVRNGVWAGIRGVGGVVVGVLALFPVVDPGTGAVLGESYVAGVIQRLAGLFSRNGAHVAGGQLAQPVSDLGRLRPHRRDDRPPA